MPLTALRPSVIIFAIFVVPAWLGLASAAHAQKVSPVNLEGGAAVQGYDVVAYFTDGEPTKGSKDHSHTIDGATYRFASAENRDLFVANPQKYAPQFGGYCAFAVSRGYTATVDPTAWEVVDDKLYLNFSHAVKAKWEKNRAENIAKGHRNWPRILAGK
jgi:YHS domain-containing protein